mmetsp:Transcript_29073/g.45573  ORF Transcript_29073/g.45573 Transcript_29073/m.45573 type:complete len:88 (-) Transcript_29073:85-348(-)|eukprot:CAMPEP_0184292926 /NCGR_PEP_ID=MMETSP1049-20130417/4579_1 /TAXON_ID=77928 /ORGANISM="Proteomonas sulcata, Strain CCMP704" /LENGTH=87 /DNA_ID=CAMNT_0026600849 /DNA_START=325 /DNA_END=588 /DNA_ORIENTATION=+
MAQVEFGFWMWGSEKEVKVLGLQSRVLAQVINIRFRFRLPLAAPSFASTLPPPGSAGVLGSPGAKKLGAEKAGNPGAEDPKPPNPQR